jgi:hypothetical protein
LVPLHNYGVALLLLRQRCGAASNGLGTTTKYLHGAVGIGLGTTSKYLRLTTMERPEHYD